MPDDGRVTSITSNQTLTGWTGFIRSLGEFSGLRVNASREMVKRSIDFDVQFYTFLRQLDYTYLYAYSISQCIYTYTCIYVYVYVYKDTC